MALALKLFFLRAVRCLIALYLPDGGVSKVITASSGVYRITLDYSMSEVTLISSETLWSTSAIPINTAAMSA